MTQPPVLNNASTVQTSNLRNEFSHFIPPNKQMNNSKPAVLNSDSAPSSNRQMNNSNSALMKTDIGQSSIISSARQLNNSNPGLINSDSVPSSNRQMNNSNSVLMKTDIAQSSNIQNSEQNNSNLLIFNPNSGRSSNGSALRNGTNANNSDANQRPPLNSSSKSIKTVSSLDGRLVGYLTCESG